MADKSRPFPVASSRFVTNRRFLASHPPSLYLSHSTGIFERWLGKDRTPASSFTGPTIAADGARGPTAFSPYHWSPFGALCRSIGRPRASFSPLLFSHLRRRQGPDPPRERRQPAADRGWVVIDDMKHARRGRQGGDGCDRRVLDADPRSDAFPAPMIASSCFRAWSAAAPSGWHQVPGP